MMKKIMLFLMLVVGSTVYYAQAADLEESVAAALVAVDKKAGESGLLVLTDAPYVQVEGASALPFLAIVQEATGCTVGKGNLLFFQRPQEHPLRFMLMNKESGKAVIVSRNDQSWRSESLQLDRGTLASPEFWEETKSLHAARDIFSLAGIGAAWAMDAPYDYLRVAELHNHLCPGVTSGYLLAHYIKNHFPLEKGQKYTVIASPVWCKEDAMQVILDCTAGKRSIVVKHLDEETVKQVSIENPAGMVLVYDPKKKTGKGYALTFDFGILKGYAPKDSPKVAVVLAGIEHIENPDEYVTTAASFDLDESIYNKITRAGSNPYEVAELMRM